VGILLPEKDVVVEANRIVSSADSKKVTLRLLGGLAFRLRNPSSVQANLSRRYVDIDFVGFRKQRKEIEKLFEDLGYTPRDRFNKLNGYSRLIFNDIANERRVDIFLNTFEMSHKLDFTDRLLVDKLTLPLCDLLLTKLQVYEITEREYRDVIALFIDHDLSGKDEPEKINAKYIAKLCSQDWGLYRTITLNLERIEGALPTYNLSPEQQAMIKGKFNQLRKVIEDEPKSFSWKMRARVGDKVKWYELPEQDVEVVDSRPVTERQPSPTDSGTKSATS
jgi:hypothetical protein